MNVKLLRKVAKHILEEPKRFDMGNFGYLMPASEGGPQCGTVCCIAGWGTLLDRHTKAIGTYKICTLVGEDEGRKSLKLTVAQSERLFFLSGWPKQFVQPYWRATLQGRAELAAARIEHFIRTKGRE